MRSFILSIAATLAFTVFSFAVPMPAEASPVNAIAARHDDHSKRISLEVVVKSKGFSLEVVLNTAIDVITPITEELGCIKGEDATVEKIGPVIFKLKVAVNDVIADVKVLGSLPLERILRTFAGGVLDAVAIAKLLACLLNLIFGVFGSLLAGASVSTKAEIIALLADVGCLVGSLLRDIFGLANSLVIEIVACLLPQISGCFDVIKMLDIKLISFLGISL